jgi:hypothetical protein
MRGIVSRSSMVYADNSLSFLIGDGAVVESSAASNRSYDLDLCLQKGAIMTGLSCTGWMWLLLGGAVGAAFAGR